MTQLLYLFIDFVDWAGPWSLIPIFGPLLVLSYYGAQNGRYASPSSVIGDLYRDHGPVPFQELVNSNFNLEYWKTFYPKHYQMFKSTGLLPITRETAQEIYQATNERGYDGSQYRR